MTTDTQTRIIRLTKFRARPSVCIHAAYQYSKHQYGLALVVHDDLYVLKYDSTGKINAVKQSAKRRYQLINYNDNVESINRLKIFVNKVGNDKLTYIDRVDEIRVSKDLPHLQPELSMYGNSTMNIILAKSPKIEYSVVTAVQLLKTDDKLIYFSNHSVFECDYPNLKELEPPITRCIEFDLSDVLNKLTLLDIKSL